MFEISEHILQVPMTEKLMSKISISSNLVYAQYCGSI